MYAEPKESLKLDEISNCVNEILIAGPNMLTPSSDNISVGNHPNVSTPFDGSTTNNNSPPTVELNIKVNQPPKFATEKPVENVEQLNFILEESNGADSPKKQDLTPVLSDNAYLETGRNDIRKKIKKDLTAPSTKTKGEKSLLSASSDSTIKVWNAHEGICMATLRPHRDYAKCLAYAKDVEVEASAGLEKTIYLWNIEDLAAFFSTKNNVKASKVHDKSSIYSLAISPHGTILACGSNEKAVGVYSVGVMNTKNPQNIMKLKGHSDNVRDLVLNRNGTQCLSSSSDGTIPLWSLGQQRGVATYRVHGKSMWALQANEFFTTVYSDERDRRVWATDLLNPDYRTLLRVEKFPILKPELEKGDTDYYSMWVATTDSTIKDWSGEYDNENIKPVSTQLNSTIEDWVKRILIAGPNMLTPSSDNISVGNHPNVSTPFDTPVLSDDDLETGRNDIRKEINTDLTAPSTKTKGEKSLRECTFLFIYERQHIVKVFIKSALNLQTF